MFVGSGCAASRLRVQRYGHILHTTKHWVHIIGFFWIFKRRLRNVAYKESFLRSVSR